MSVSWRDMSDPSTLHELQRWMEGREDEHVEFKAATKSYDFDDLLRYCVALANEGGGVLVLGVSDKRPRHVVGSRACTDLGAKLKQILDTLHFRIDAEEVPHPDGRVVVFRVPSRPVGTPRDLRGQYWMRSGESLVPMTSDKLRQIFAEAQGPDFSAQICRGAAMSDLAPEAIERFRTLWVRKSGNEELRSLSHERLLADAELTFDGGITYAALALMGTRAALGRHLAQAEIIFEYRSSDASIEAQFRHDHREGFFLIDDVLREQINARNEVQTFRDGLFVGSIPTFNEIAVREALLNAVAHRDYALGGSVFVRQHPRRLNVVSPGGLPNGVTPDNIIERHVPRNRRIAQTFQYCGFVERSGQGIDRMVRTSLEEAKHPPDFEGTDAWQVSVTLHGTVLDERFLAFMQKLKHESSAGFHLDDLVVLDLVHRDEPVPPKYRDRINSLRDRGAIETIGRGRGQRVVLARQFYEFVGKPGDYTRRKGLDHETNKHLLLRHITESAEIGSPMADLQDVLPALSRGQLRGLLNELRQEGKAEPRGTTRAARWHPLPGSRAAKPSDGG